MGLRSAIIAVSFTAVAFGQQSGRPDTEVGHDLRDVISLDPARVVAGESFLRPLAGLPISAITSVRVFPPLKRGVHVHLVTEISGATRLRLTTPPAMPRGDYQIEIAGTRPDGRRVVVNVQLTVDAMTIPKSTIGKTPVILLNGFQLVCTDFASTVSASQDTFGSLASFLQSDGIPVAYFNNCSEGAVPIEELANDLKSYIAALTFADGTPITQVDLVAHSMGGLITRAYLAGLQTNGSLNPPPNPEVRKVVLIATPNFGSFEGVGLGVQAPEMVPGSPFLWNLATWNQRGDDLRGTDALAIVGNAGNYYSPSNADDGVVSLTSGSIGFSRNDQRTRVVPYCHITPGISTLFGTVGMRCTSARGIADIDFPTHLTAKIVRSFLGGDSAWMALGSTPSSNYFLSQYGGIYFAEQTAAGQWITDTSAKVSFGSYALSAGGASGTVFYDEFVTGTYSFVETGSSFGACGPFTEPLGYYTAFRCKYSPLVFSVGPSSTGVPGTIVQSGGSITINGSGLGQPCSSCAIFAYPGPVALQVTSWTDSAVSAFLPSTFSGFVQLVVQTSFGSDEINIMTAPAALPPTIALTPAQLNFSYTVGGVVPVSQSVTVSNTGGGTFTWSPTPSASWLALATAPGVLTVSVNPTGLPPNIYSGTIAITGAGASNSPQTVSVTLAVMAAPTLPPTISLSGTHASFAYVAGSAAPSPQTITISNSGGGTLSWSASTNASWLFITPAGTAPSNLAISINPTGLNVGSYNGAITLTATGATNSPKTISVTLTITAAAATVTVTSVTNAASSASGAIAPGEIVAIKGSGLGSATGVSFSVNPSTGMVDTTLAGTQVFFGSVAAPILYTSAGQVNAIVPYEVAGQTQIAMQVQYQGVSSTGTTLKVASAAPGLFTFNSTGTGPAAALNQDYSLNGPSNPAAAGSYVTLYFTGGGETNPAGVTGSITGSVLKWLIQNITVTVGGQPGTVAFDGAAPTFIDGFLQLNLGLPPGVHGTVPVIVNVDGIASPATATIAIQ